MEELKTMGLVIREQRLKEADKLLTVLTPDDGKITVMGKGVASLRSHHMVSAQIFAYSNFVLRKSKKYFYIADSDPSECFFNIRFDVEKLALANYMCDVACDLALENVSDPELLRLMLNSLYALGNKKDIPNEQIRGAFEFRAAVQSGYLPILDGCGVCGGEITGDFIPFDVMNGFMKCPKCAHLVEKTTVDPDRTANIVLNVTPPIIEALRYIAEAPVNKYLLFKLHDEEMPMFSAFCETFLTSHLEHTFSSLKYYKKIKHYGKN